jgi:hypothetical protein
LVNSEEFSDILNQPINKDNYLGDWDPTKTYFIPEGQTYTITYGGKNWEITGGPGGTTIPVGQYPGTVQGDFDPGLVYTTGQTVLYNGKYYVNYGPKAINPGDPLPGAAGSGWTLSPWTTTPEQNLTDIISTYNKNLAINDAQLKEAARILPKSGYNNTALYVVPTYVNNEPAPPVDLLIPQAPATAATIDVINNSKYRVSSPVLRIKSDALTNINEMIQSVDADMTIDQFISMSLNAVTTVPEKSDTGSGRVSGDAVLVARTLGDVTGPYGTADNTYANADAFLRITVTALGSAVTSNVIALDNTSNLADLYPELLLAATVATQNGTLISPFAPDTRIVSVDHIARAITISAPLVADMPAGTAVICSADFTGVVSQQMDWRADCDPRFQFIKRFSPRSFGYAAGYGSGTTQFPNGEPAGSGTSFPANPTLGDYFLRIDYSPQILYRWDGALWIEISQDVRTTTSLGAADRSQRSTFINNQALVKTTNGQYIPSRQGLSDAGTIQPD